MLNSHPENPENEKPNCSRRFGERRMSQKEIRAASNSFAFLIFSAYLGLRGEPSALRPCRKSASEPLFSAVMASSKIRRNSARVSDNAKRRCVECALFISGKPTFQIGMPFLERSIFVVVFDIDKRKRDSVRAVSLDAFFNRALVV